MPITIRWLNLGILDDEHFRAAVAPEYGVANLDDAEVIKLGELAQEAQRLPDGIRRNKVYQEMIDIIVASQGIKTMDLAKDVWFANVLSGIRTWIDVGVGSWISALTMTARASIDSAVHGKPILAYRIASSFISSTGEAIANAADIIATGDLSRLPDTQKRLWNILHGRGRIDTLAAAKKRGSGWQKALGQLSYVRRIMIGLDYVGALGARNSMLLYTAASRGDLESLQAAMKRFDKAETARALEQAKSEMGPKAKWVDVKARQREILEAGVNAEIKEGAATLGAVAALNADPVGWGGIMYRIIAWMPWVARTASGLSFARAAINMAQNASDWLPMAGAVNWGRAAIANTEWFQSLPDRHPMRLFGLDVPPERRRLIASAQIGGLALTAAAVGIFLARGGDDDDERLVDISGTWFGVNPRIKSQLLSEGERPLSIRVGDTWISYKNTPFASALAFVGNLRDKQRFRRESFDAENAVERLINAWILGFTYIKDVSALSQFSQTVGAAAIDTRDELANANRSLAETLGNTTAGFIPMVSMLREIDTITEPAVFRPNGGIEFWLRNIPFARRTIGPGPAVNALGDEIEAPRLPWGRWINMRPDDPEWTLLSKLASRGAFVPVPSKTATIVTDQGRRQMNPTEFYEYQQLAGRAWRQAISDDAGFLEDADGSLARAWFERKTEAVHRAARARVEPSD